MLALLYLLYICLQCFPEFINFQKPPGFSIFLERKEFCSAVSLKSAAAAAAAAADF
jgi:hypothetical protein